MKGRAGKGTARSGVESVEPGKAESANPDKRNARKKPVNDAIGKKAKDNRIIALPTPDRTAEVPAVTPHDPNLMDVSRMQWQHGDWADLAQISLDSLTNHPGRDRLALIVAAAHAHLGDMPQARRFADRALGWGCSPTVVAQVLISAAHNTLARAATCLQDPAAITHFTAALRIVEPKGDLPLLSRSRQIRETTRLGLLPEAADLLAIDMARVALAPVDHAAELAILDTRLKQLKHELSHFRGQLFGSPVVAQD